MTTVFIAGSISISRLHDKVQQRIHNIVNSDLNIIVGDADGADKAIQECLHNYQAERVTVYCTGDKPRNNVAQWPVHRVHSKAKVGSRAYYTAKDLEMARHSDYGLMVWDCKSTGTLSNVVQLLTEKKKTVIFVNKDKDFVTVSDTYGLNHLLTFMTPHARSKAELKIGLSSTIANLAQRTLVLETVREENILPDSNVKTAAQENQTDTPASAESMKLRSELMSALKDYISRTQLSQSQAAKLFGVTQPRISDLTRGKVDLFGLDALVNMAATAGLTVEMRLQSSSVS